MSEIPHANTYAPELIEFAESNEVWKDPITRREYFENISGDDFIDLTQRVASLVRTGDDRTMQPFDGYGVQVANFSVPDQRDKEKLLREAWDTAQSFLRDRGLSDEDALTLAALTAAGGIIFTHPYYDGNGRTSRALSYLIARGNTDAENLEEIVASERSFNEVWDSDPYSELADLYEKEYYVDGPQPDEIDWKRHASKDVGLLGVDPNKDDDAEVVLNYDSLALRQYIEAHDKDVETLLGRYQTTDENGETHLDGNSFLRALIANEKSGISAARELLQYRREANRGYVRAYLRAMKSHEYIPESFVESMAKPIEAFQVVPRYEKERQRFATEFGKRAVNGKMTPAAEQLGIHFAKSEAYHKPTQTKS